MTVRVKEIIEGVDMRSVHKLRVGFRARRLRKGSCLIAFNKTHTIARIIDWKHGVHTYYAEKGTMFDAALLRSLVKVAFHVDLDEGEKKAA